MSNNENPPAKPVNFKLYNMVKEMSPQELSQVHFYIKNDFLRDAPKTPEELWLFCKVMFNFEWPITKCSDDTNAPFQWIWDWYSKKHSQMLTLAPRGGYKTFGQAQMTYIDAHFNPYYETMTVSALRKQSGVSQKYLKSFYSDPALKRGFSKRPSATKAEWESGSIWEIVTGTTAGISGHHPVQLCLDEIEFWNIEAIEQSWAVPQDRGKYRRIWAGFSTRQRCLPALTGIMTRDGIKNICEIVNTEWAGEVRSFNFKKKQWEWKKVCGWHKNRVTNSWVELYADTERPLLTATGNHEVYYTHGKKKPLADFQPGDSVFIFDNESNELLQKTVTRIVEMPRLYSLRYDISVKDNHNYCVESGVLISNSFGGMSYLTNKIEAEDTNIKLYQWNVFEIMQRCATCLCIKGGRVISNPTETCALWDDCRGELAKKSSGTYPREHMCDQKRNLTQDAWNTQYLCKKPSTHGLVLYNFEHIYSEVGNVNRGNYVAWDYDSSLPYYVFHDPAEGAVSHALLVQIYAGRMYIFAEIHDKECFSVDKVKLALQQLQRAKGIKEDPALVIVDPHRPDALRVWLDGSFHGEGIGKSYKAELAPLSGHYTKIEHGLELLRSLICNGAKERFIFINPRNCKETVLSFRENHYKLKPDGSLEEGAIQSKDFKDAIDCLRYGTIWAVVRNKIGNLRKVALLDFS